MKKLYEAASWLISTVVPDYNKLRMNEYRKELPKIKKIFEGYKKRSKSPASITQGFIQRLEKGEKIEKLFNEACANVLYACHKLDGYSYTIMGGKQSQTWVMQPYDVQIIGGLNLAKGIMSEMKTGEGKTLVAAFPVYIHSLVGKGTHVVSVNDYLTQRDKELLEPLYTMLGRTVGNVISTTAQSQRKEEYGKDITYVTNNELGFDYLRDNLVSYKSEKNIPHYYFALIDEVDSILIDDARMPLIISEQKKFAAEQYTKWTTLVNGLKPAPVKKQENRGEMYNVLHDIEEQEIKPSWHYFVDQATKNIMLTQYGLNKIEKLLSKKYVDLTPEDIHYLYNALKAKECYKKGVEYIVEDGQVKLVDQGTGRIQEGRRYAEGLHQAIEAKENVEIQGESETVAQITYQGFFDQYERFVGMSGTILSEAEELDKIYKVDTYEIPTNKPVIRVDLKDKLYETKAEKYEDMIRDIESYHSMGIPLLLGTSSITGSEELSDILQRHGLSHSVLNAKHHEQEASIIEQGGKLHSIIVATNMAGRGTDIKLEKDLDKTIAANYLGYVQNHYAILSIPSVDEYEVVNDVYDYLVNKKGIKGLQMENPVIEKDGSYTLLFNKQFAKDQSQLPEKTQVHLGLGVLGSERHESVRIDNQLRGRAGRQGQPGFSQFYISKEDDLVKRVGIPKTLSKGTSFIDGVQRKIESESYQSRKHINDYETIINKQRKVVYTMRDECIDEAKDIIDIAKENQIIHKGIVALQDEYSPHELMMMFQSLEFRQEDFEKKGKNSKSHFEKVIYQYILETVQNGGDTIKHIYRTHTVSILDQLWIEYIRSMDDLKNSLAIWSYAQKDPLIEFKKQSHEIFRNMVESFYRECIILYCSVDNTYGTESEEEHQEKLDSMSDFIDDIEYDEKVMGGSSDEFKQDAVELQLESVSSKKGKGKKFEPANEE